MENNKHIPVLKNEVISLLNIKNGGTYVDCTAGRGGHSFEILKKIGKNGKLICIDMDDEAINFLKSKFNSNKNVEVVKSNFSEILSILKEKEIKSVDGIIADLGVSSPMLDNAERGFSYLKKSRLDMRMDQQQKIDAWHVVNKYDKNQLIEIFKKYGEIKKPIFVAEAILNYRKTKNIETTDELVEIIKSNVKKSDLFKKKHPARTYFQAIRMEVNDELYNLEKLLKNGPNLLNIGGNMIIITFHSLEDKMVKQHFNFLTTSQLPKEIPIIDENIKYNLINKKALQATENEINENRRSRSAKVRGIIRVKK